MKNKTAILILSCKDFESLEMSLACHSKFLPEGAKIFILQNGRGTYDTERTYEVAKRYHRLFPSQIEVIDWIAPKAPYHAIQELLDSDVMKNYEYICKLDDDVFPLTVDWYDNLISCYQSSYEKYGENLSYVTSLVNNNPWGFIETMDIMGLREQFESKYSREHIVGIVNDKSGVYPSSIVPKNSAVAGCCGTVWSLVYLSRWMHQETTLKPDLFIEKTKNLSCKEVNNQERYSINCMLFKKEFWRQIATDSADDEHNAFLYCKNNDKKIIAALNVPMVHLFFYIQRSENKDLMPIIQEYYEKWLDLVYPIALCQRKEYENENRLRYLEDLTLKNRQTIERLINANEHNRKIADEKALQEIVSLKNEVQGMEKIFYSKSEFESMKSELLSSKAEVITLQNEIRSLREEICEAKNNLFRLICEQIFSMKNVYSGDKKYKIITLFGVKIKLKSRKIR